MLGFGSDQLYSATLWSILAKEKSIGVDIPGGPTGISALPDDLFVDKSTGFAVEVSTNTSDAWFVCSILCFLACGSSLSCGSFTFSLILSVSVCTPSPELVLDELVVLVDPDDEEDDDELDDDVLLLRDRLPDDCVGFSFFSADVSSSLSLMSTIIGDGVVAFFFCRSLRGLVTANGFTRSVDELPSAFVFSRSSAVDAGACVGASTVGFTCASFSPLLESVTAEIALDTALEIADVRSASFGPV